MGVGYSDIAPSGGDYTTLTAWESDLGSSISENAVAYCHYFSGGLNDKVTFSGAAGGLGAYCRITSHPTAHHEGQWDTTDCFYIAPSTDGDVITIESDEVIVTGIQIRPNGSSSASYGIVLDASAINVNVAAAHNIIDGHNSSYCGGIKLDSTGGTAAHAYNNIILDCDLYGINFTGYGSSLNANSNLVCTDGSGGYGIYFTGTAGGANENVVIGYANDQDYYNMGNASSTTEYNATDRTQANSGLDTHDAYAHYGIDTADEFEDFSTRDFRISSSSPALWDGGKTLAGTNTADAFPGNSLFHEALGVSHVGPWTPNLAGMVRVKSFFTDGSRGNVTSFSIDKPLCVVEGDLMVVFLVKDDDYDYTTTPTGWTSFDSGATDGSSYRCRMWWKVAGASEPSSYTWGADSEQYWGAMWVFEEYDTTTKFQETTGWQTGSSSLLSVTGMTTNRDNTLCIAFFGKDDDDRRGYSTGFNTYYGLTDGASSEASGKVCGFMAYRYFPTSSTATGSVSFTYTASDGMAGRMLGIRSSNISTQTHNLLAAIDGVLATNTPNLLLKNNLIAAIDGAVATNEPNLVVPVVHELVAAIDGTLATNTPTLDIVIDVSAAIDGSVATNAPVMQLTHNVAAEIDGNVAVVNGPSPADSFDGVDNDPPDTDMWETSGTLGSYSFTIQGNKLYGTGTSDGVAQSGYCAPKLTVGGDFEVNLEIDSFSSTSANGLAGLWFDANNYIAFATGSNLVESKVAGVKKTKPRTQDYGSFRVARSGDVWTLLYKDGDGSWAEADNDTSHTNDIVPTIFLYNSDSGTTTEANFNDFYIADGKIIWNEVEYVIYDWLLAQVDGATETNAPHLTFTWELAAEVDGVTVTNTPTLQVLTEIQSQIDGVLITNTPVMDTSVDLSAAIDGTLATNTPAIDTSVDISAAIDGTLVTNTPDLVVAGTQELLADINGVTVTNTPEIQIAHSLLAEIDGDIETNTPTLLTLARLIAAVDGTIATNIPDLIVRNDLSAEIDGVTVTNTPAIVTTVNLDAAMDAALVTNTPDLRVLTPLQAEIDGVLVTNTPALDTTVDLIAEVDGVTETNSPILNLLQPLAAEVDGSVTTNTPDLKTFDTVDLTAVIDGTTTTNTPSVDINNDVSAAIDASVATNSPVLSVLHRLSSVSDGVTETNAPALDIYTHLVGQVDGVIETNTPTLGILREIVAEIDGVTVTNTPDLVTAALKEVSATIDGSVATNAPTMLVMNDLAAEIDGEIATNTPTLVTTVSLVAEVDGVTATNTPNLQTAQVKNLSAEIDGTTATNTPSVDITASLSADVNGTLETSTPSLIIKHELSGSCDGTVGTNEPEMVVTVELTGDIAGILETGAADMETIVKLSAGITGVTDAQGGFLGLIHKLDGAIDGSVSTNTPTMFVDGEINLTANINGSVEVGSPILQFDIMPDVGDLKYRDVTPHLGLKAVPEENTVRDYSSLTAIKHN